MFPVQLLSGKDLSSSYEAYSRKFAETTIIFQEFTDIG